MEKYRNYNQPQLAPSLQLFNSLFVLLIIKPIKYIFLKATETNAKRRRKTA